MAFIHSGDQAAIRETIARLGQEKFQPRMSGYDETASFPFENYDDLRREGLLGLTVPRDHGGLGAEYEDYTHHAAELGSWCGATALTFNMHACTPLWIGPIADTLDLSDEDRRAHPLCMRSWRNHRRCQGH